MLVSKSVFIVLSEVTVWAEGSMGPENLVKRELPPIWGFLLEKFTFRLWESLPWLAC